MLKCDESIGALCAGETEGLFVVLASPRESELRARGAVVITVAGDGF